VGVGAGRRCSAATGQLRGAIPLNVPEPTEPRDRALRITAIVAAYNEADIIAQSVGDLVRQGIAVHLLDHQSSDGTVSALAPLLDSGLVHIEPIAASQSPVGHKGQFVLAEILARKEQLARDLDADWLINHDADEFRESPWRHLSLRQGIEMVDRLGYNAIDFAVLNFWPTEDEFDSAADIREAFRYYEPGEYFDRLQVRCWKKTGAVDLVSTGGHDVQFPSRQVFPLRFILRHYPIRSQAHGTRKVFEERIPRFTSEERERGWHVQYDSVGAGHQFVRDPRTLRPYDPEAIRVDLQIHHRQVEALTSALDEAGAERRAALETLEDERASRAAEIRSLRLQLEDQARTYAQLAHHAESVERQIADLTRSWSWKLTGPLRAIARGLGMGRSRP